MKFSWEERAYKWPKSLSSTVKRDFVGSAGQGTEEEIGDRIQAGSGLLAQQGKQEPASSPVGEAKASSASCGSGPSKYPGERAEYLV